MSLRKRGNKRSSKEEAEEKKKQRPVRLRGDYGEDIKKTLRSLYQLMFIEDVPLTILSQRFGLSYNRLKRIKQQGPETIDKALVPYDSTFRGSCLPRSMINAIANSLDAATAPITFASIQADLSGQGMPVPNRWVLSKILHKRLNATFRKVNAITAKHNSTRAKLERQFASGRYIQLLS